MKTRYKLPVWLWWLLMPLPFVVSFALMGNLLSPVLLAAKMLNAVIAPLLATLIWSLLSPDRRIIGATVTAICFSSYCFLGSFLDWGSSPNDNGVALAMTSAISSFLPALLFRFQERRQP